MSIEDNKQFKELLKNRSPGLEKKIEFLQLICDSTVSAMYQGKIDISKAREYLDEVYSIENYYKAIMADLRDLIWQRDDGK